MTLLNLEKYFIDLAWLIALHESNISPRESEWHQSQNIPSDIKYTIAKDIGVIPNELIF